MTKYFRFLTLDAQSKPIPRAASTSITIKLSLHFTAEIL